MKALYSAAIKCRIPLVEKRGTLKETAKWQGKKNATSSEAEGETTRS